MAKLERREGATAVLLQRGAQLVHGLVALVLVDGHGLHDEVGQARRQPRVDLARRPRLALHVLVHDRHVIAARVGRHAGQHFVEDDAERVDVGALVDLLAEDLLGRHVLRRADDVAGLGELRVAFALRGGDAEVHDLEQAFLVDQHVRGLEVAMHDARPGARRPCRCRCRCRSRARACSGIGFSLTTSLPSVCEGKYSIEMA